MHKHLLRNDLFDPLQSAYRPNHSTETALIRIFDDLLTNLDNKKVILLALLDLSAAFDTVDHTILLERLCHTFGISGQALKWFTSYLSDRSQVVRLFSVNGVKSSSQMLECCVPQGFVLGPSLYSRYTKPIGNIIRNSDIQFHLFADDCQLYVSLDPACTTSHIESLTHLKNCIAELSDWMFQNILKLNNDKTEFIVIGLGVQKAKINSKSITVGGHAIKSATAARNLGVWIDESLSMVHQIQQVSKSTCLQICNISRIRPFLTQEAAQILIHALILSRLDYANALYYGLPDSLIQELQHVQNAAACLVCQVRKYDHITPVLKSLHWLPVRQRIEFKILLITFKAVNGCASTYISSLLKSDSKKPLSVPRTRYKSFGDRAFSTAAPKLWNKLPLKLRNCNTISDFRKQLETQLFKIAYEC